MKDGGYDQGGRKILKVGGRRGVEIKKRHRIRKNKGLEVLLAEY